MKMRVLVVDDTIVYRKIVSDVISAIPGVEIVGTASNGKIALARIKELKPDLITLDIEMPEMNGLEVLEAIRREGLYVGVIVLSSLTAKGSEFTMKALELGAFDFITKPEGISTEDSKATIERTIVPIFKAFSSKREIQAILKGELKRDPGEASRKPQATPGVPPGTPQAGVTRLRSTVARTKSEVIAIGISTGGPNALMEMLPKIPGDINVPILIVQHMPPMFTKSLAHSLDAKCTLSIKEAQGGEPIHKNVVYIAPGGKQMKVSLGADASTKIIRITDDPPENNCRPSADYLFRSVAHHYYGRATGVIMTGMGNDGTVGLKLMKRNGSVVIAQDETTSVVFGMPKEAIEAGVVDTVAPLSRIADEIVRTVR